jgi:HD-GYP domain-containing protein (c-di-GMP phosphodiesterase class II)
MKSHSIIDASHHRFFLKHLSTFSQHEPVNVIRDIYDAPSKTKLISEGSRLNSASLRKLEEATLQTPIVSHIQCISPLSTSALKLRMRRSLARSPAISQLLLATKKQQVILEYLNLVSLPLPMVNLLTIMGHQLPFLFEHSLDVALIGTCLALQCGRLIDPAHVMHAGLFHDVGLMFLNATLLDSERPLSWAEWSQMYTHPTLSQELLQSFPGSKMPQAISSAVLQHHERLDGSGYPHGLSGKRLGDAGRILAVAEVTASIARYKTKDYLLTVLNANNGKLDDDLLELLQRILANVSRDEFIAASMRATTFRLVDAITDAVVRWHLLGQEITGLSALSKIQTGISAVERILWNSGFSSDQISAGEQSIEIALSPETTSAFMESHYQLGQILHDVYRNKAQYMALQPRQASMAFGRWVAETQHRLNQIDEENTQKKSPAAALASRAEAESPAVLLQTASTSLSNLSNIQWFYLKNQKKYGPHNNIEVLNKIQSGELLMSDLIWQVGFSYWRTIQDAAELLYSDEAKQQFSPALFLVVKGQSSTTPPANEPLAG